MFSLARDLGKEWVVRWVGRCEGTLLEVVLKWHESKSESGLQRNLALPTTQEMTQAREILLYYSGRAFYFLVLKEKVRSISA
jgi:hypothetical protein